MLKSFVVQWPAMTNCCRIRFQRDTVAELRRGGWTWNRPSSHPLTRLGASSAQFVPGVRQHRDQNSSSGLGRANRLLERQTDGSRSLAGLGRHLEPIPSMPVMLTEVIWLARCEGECHRDLF